MNGRAWVFMLGLASGLAGAQEAGDPAGEPAGEADAPLLPTIPADEPVAPALPDSPVALDEIVVTAERKVASVKDTPISLTAFNEKRLEVEGVTSLVDIAASVPSMTIEPFPINNSTLRIFIRGVGINDAQITQDAPVGIYLDGAYIARSTGTALDLAELERIEILRGPQGTLYGRNSTGGTINLITKRPSTDALHVKQTVRLGDLGYLHSRTSVNFPVGGAAAAKVALLYSAKDGFIGNLGPGGDFGDRSVTGWRADLRWDLADALLLDYGYDHSDIDFHNHTYQPIRARPPVPPNPNPQAHLAGQVQNSAQTRVTHREDRWTEATTAAPLDPSRSVINGHSLTLTWDASALWQLKYIGAYRDLLDQTYADLSGGGGFADYRLDYNPYTSRDGSVTFARSAPELRQEQFSHELQLTGAWGPFEYVSGLYYFTEEASEFRPFGHQFNAPIEVQETAPGTFTASYLINLVGFTNQIDNTAAGAFVSLTWIAPILDDRLRLTLGLRHSEDTREASKQFRTQNLVETETTSPSGTSATPPSSLTNTSFAAAGATAYTDNSVEFVTKFALTRTINLYAKYSEAYKSGGFNTRDPDPVRFQRGFAPEYVNSVELGLKSDLFGRRVRLDADVFSSDYTDVQLNFLINNSIADTQVVNAGAATMQGLELSATGLVVRDLALMLDYAYLDTDVTRATDPDTGADVTHTFTFASAPRHSGAASLDYTAARWQWGQLGLNLGVSYVGTRNGSVRVPSVPDTRVDPYHVINARLGLYDMPIANGLLTAALWGRNLEDTDYVINAIDNLPHAQRSAIWGEPRTLGLDLIYSF